MTLKPVPPRRLPRPIREFLDTEAASGILLLIGALVALTWANSPWDGGYESLWSSEVELAVGPFGFHGDLRAFVNEALMALFFFVVGLEIKREMTTGELRAWKTAALPVFAAIGGMVVPAALYLVFNASGPGSRGWGIPMATDIAFAVGILSLLSRRVPSSLTVFLLSLAIVDDIGSIVVIAVFYTSQVDLGALAVAAGLLGVMGMLRYARVFWLPITFALGAGVWLAVHESGVHATIAGVVLGLLAPARPLAPATVARDWALDLTDDPTQAELKKLSALARRSVSFGERLETLVHPLTSYVIVPVFALANAGVPISLSALGESAPSRVAAGIVAGLVVGKLVGILGASWIAVRLGFAALPSRANWSHVAGVAGVAGIGFTVSLFIADLAFDDASLVSAAKLGVLGASAVAAGVGSAVLLLTASNDRGSAAG
ncbi:MAG: Na+/H+ antiporter NhaA [Acidimicrobiales bacterium]